MDARVTAVHLSDRFDGFDSVSTSLLLTGGNWEGETVNDDVFDPHVPITNQGVNQP